MDMAPQLYALSSLQAHLSRGCYTQLKWKGRTQKVQAAEGELGGYG